MSEGLYSPKVKPDGSYETLTVVKEGAIDWLTLNRPAALNAMSRTMMLELQHYFGELYTNHSVQRRGHDRRGSRLLCRTRSEGRPRSTASRVRSPDCACSGASAKS